MGVPEEGEVDAMKVDPLESGSLDGSHLGDSIHNHRSAQDIGKDKNVKLFETVQVASCWDFSGCLVDNYFPLPLPLWLL